MADERVTGGSRLTVMSDTTTDALLARLASVPDLLDAVLATMPEAPLEPTAEPGGQAAVGEAEWSVSEIVGHLCDAARYWGARMRRAVYEEAPQLEPFDQDALVRLAAYRYIPREPLAREFRLVSAATVAWLRTLRAEQWERVGVHAERGPLSVRAMVEIEAGHELQHVELLSPRDRGK